ncbi:MAG: hypothetical protein WBG89_10865 [Ornithinimicrobium sp.]
MGWFGKDEDREGTAQETELDDTSYAARASVAMVRKIVDVGIDGVGPFHSASEMVASARAEHDSVEEAVDALVKTHLKLAAVGGFATGVGGLITMPVALPANVVGFYALAARMAAGVAELRGYDSDTDQTRTALMLTLLGADADDILRKVGVTGGGTMGRLAVSRVPRAAAMVINKGVGFRVATRLGTRTLAGLGRAVPLAGGVIGAGLDTYLMRRIAGSVREEFSAI